MRANEKAAPAGECRTRPVGEAKHSENRTTRGVPQAQSRSLQAAFRTSPDCWPGVDFLHVDALADESLFVESELYRIFLDAAADRPRVEYGGPLPPSMIDRLAYVVGGFDFGFVLSTSCGDGHAYAVLRARDLETILGLGNEPMTWRTK